MRPEYTIQDLQNIIMDCVSGVRRYNRDPIQVIIGYEWYIRLNEHLRRYGQVTVLGSTMGLEEVSYQYISGSKTLMKFHGIPMVTTHRTAVGCEVICEPFEEALLGAKTKQAIREHDSGYHNGSVDDTIKYEDWLRRERIKNLDEIAALKEKLKEAEAEVASLKSRLAEQAENYLRPWMVLR